MTTWIGGDALCRLQPTFRTAGGALEVECEYERLRKWAIDNGLIDVTAGPANMVDTVIRLVERMDERIRLQKGQLEVLGAKRSSPDRSGMRFGPASHHG